MEKRFVIASVVAAFALVVAGANESASGYSLVAWGDNRSGDCDVPARNHFAAIGAGGAHSLALLFDGSLAAWGNNYRGQCNVPEGNDFVTVAAGGSHSLALRSDGTLAAWGRNSQGQCAVPEGNDFVAIAAGQSHSLALKSDGSIVAWGLNDDGQCNVPGGSDFAAIAAGSDHSLAVRSDGSLMAWGFNEQGQCSVPGGNNYVAVAGGMYHSLALRSDGSLAAWGHNGDGQCNVPGGNNYVAVAAGVYHSVALRSDGSLAAWGINGHGQCNVPQGNYFVGIDAGNYHNLALSTKVIPLYLSGPNGGETLVAGSTYHITWETLVDIAMILIEYSIDGGQTWHNVDTIVNTDSYEWLVPTVHSDQCLVRVSDANDPNANDASDAAFTMEIHVMVPDVGAMTLAGAESVLVDANLTLANVTYECNDSLPEGHVSRQNPAAGADVVIGSAVDLVVSVCDLSSITMYFYVDDDAPEGGHGRSWSSAHKYLQDGLQQAKEEAENTWAPVEICVGAGIYRPDQDSAQPNGSADRYASFQLINGVTIRGGYAGVGPADPNRRDVELHQTILSGDLDGNDVDVNEPCDLPHEPTRCENSYHVVTASGTDETAVLDGFIVCSGNANGPYPAMRGGGLWNYSGSPTLTNCTFTSSSAESSGGAAYDGRYSKATFSDCTFSNNFGRSGGAMCITGEPSLLNCLFLGNSAKRGGGMSVSNGEPILDHCTFTHNSAGRYGGGIYGDVSYATLTHCTFFENVASKEGGATYDYESEHTLVFCTFIRNSAPSGGAISHWDDDLSLSGCRFIFNSAEEGGAIYGQSYDAVLSNCTFVGNSAGADGGGMYADHTDATVTNCTFSHNLAGEYGGGIYWRHSSATLSNCILWANCDIDGTDESAQSHGGSPVVNYSCVQSWTGALGGIGNTDADPCFVDPGYWDPNGTPGDVNDDYWVDGDYHLLAGSPCIDAGDPNYVPGPNETDLDGNPRVLDGDEDGNSVVDMGAYEFWPPIDCPMHFTPKAVNLRSRGKWIKAHFVLPAGYTMEDVDTHTPAAIVELGLHSEHVRAFSEGGSVKVEAAFDRREFCRAGPFEGLVTVEGTLANGRCFQGAESIKIVGGNSELLADLASYWLVADCGRPDWCGGSDLNQDSIVDFVDFAFFDSCCEVI